MKAQKELRPACHFDASVVALLLGVFSE